MMTKRPFTLSSVEQRGLEHIYVSTSLISLMPANTQCSAKIHIYIICFWEKMV